MFERFTDRARRVVVLAQEEARRLNHNYIGTEHILLGLIQEGEGHAAKALEELSINIDSVRSEVVEIIGEGQQSPSGHIPFTPRAKKVLELSLREALQLGHNYIGTEHILLGLIREGEGVAAQVLKKLGAELSQVRQTVIKLISSSGEGKKPQSASTGGRERPGSGTGSAILDQFGRNLTRMAKEGKLDPVIGRSTEIERVMQILSRRTKNNPVLIGEPGVGKTAIVEGLAQKIVSGDIPVTLKGKQIYTLDLSSLVAGSRYRGDFEERLKKVLKEIKTRGDIVLFIRVLAGPEKKSRLMSDEEKKIIAYHETGHALVGWALPNADPIHKVTIIPRGRALGYTQALPEREKYLSSKAELKDRLAMLMGGRVAEELVFKDPTTGASNDIEKATEIARRMVMEFGMSDKLGPMLFGKGSNEVFLGRDYGRQQDYSDEVASSIDDEVKILLNDAHAIAGKILKKFKKQMDAMVEVLMEKETIDREEVSRIFKSIKKVKINGSGKTLKLA